MARSLKSGIPLRLESLEPRILLSGVPTYTFHSLASLNGTNGSDPLGAMVADGSGNLYGTTSSGGASSCGSVFEIKAGSSTITTLASFNVLNGSDPTAGLIIGPNGTLYGTTEFGGASGVKNVVDSGYGCVFEVVAGSNTITPLASFNETNGSYPGASLLLDAKGDLFGTANSGGANSGGTLFEVAAGSGAITTLASFASTSFEPVSALIMDSGGNLYGTTQRGGTGGCGTVFELPSGSSTINTLVQFAGTNGATPVSGLVMDGSGNLYGTTSIGGSSNDGTVFELTASSSYKTVSTLVTFTGTNGANPMAGLILDSNGNLFGTTWKGGADSDGTAFVLPKGGSQVTTLVTFDGTNGQYPEDPLYRDGLGNISGTTTTGGTDADGTVFEFTPATTAATQLAFIQQPAYTHAGSAITPPVTVGVEDANEDVVTSNTSSVTLTISSGTLNGTLTEAAVNGVATFSDLSVPAVGTYTLKATDPAGAGLTSATSASFTVALAPTKLAFGQQPTSTTVGATIYPAVTVDVEDTNGDIVTDNTSDVTLTISSGSLNGTLTEAAINGVATFSNLSESTAGTYTIQATDPADAGLTAATSDSFTISYQPSQLAFNQEPSNVAFGHTMTPAVTVYVEDVFGDVLTNNSSNVTLAISSGTLNGTLTEAAVDGMATFSNLSVPAAGTYTLQATDGGLNSATSTSFTVTGAGVKLAFSGQPSDTAAGTAISPSVTVEIEDAGGNVVTSDDSSVTLALGAGSGSLNGTLTEPAVNGVATFSGLSITQAGNYTLSASDSADGLSGFTSDSFAITPAAASKLVFTTEPTGGTAGAQPSVAVTIEDPYGNVETGDNSTVSLSLSSGTLGGTTSVAAKDGVATFSALSITEAGSNYTLSAADTTDGLSGFTSGSFAVGPAAASKLVFTSQPAAGTAGQTLGTVAVTIEDTYGNVETGDSSNVSLSLTGGTLGGTTSVAAKDGVATFSALSVTEAGSNYTLSAADTTDQLSGCASGGFDISPASANKLVFTTQPAGGTAGQTLPAVAATIEDQYGNVETGDDSTVSLSLSSGTLGGTTSAAAKDGVATFGALSMTEAGSDYTLSAADTSDNLSGFASGSFNISPASASKLVFTTEPVSGTVGGTLPAAAVTIEDQYGNVEMGDNSTVSLSLSSGMLGGTTSVAAKDGVATFGSLSVSETGSNYTLSASDATDDLSGFTSGSFNISPASASKLIFTTQPAGGTAGQTLGTVVVTIEDPSGNVETEDSSNVSLSSGSGTLQETTSVAAADGVATFTGLFMTKAGNDYTLSAADATDDLSGFASGSFNISPASASKLVFTAQPAGGTAGQTLPAVAATIEDQYGNVETGDNSAVSLALSGGTLGGTTSVAAKGGVATFSGLSMTEAGNNFTLSATDATDKLSGFTSGSFAVSPATASVLVFTTQPAGGTAGQTMGTVAVTIEDAYGNVETGDSSNVSLASNGGTLGGTASVAAANGAATFTGLFMTQAGNNYSLSAADSADSLSGFASGSFNISPATANKLAFTAQPAGGTAGQTLTAVQVTIEDQYGNAETGNSASTLDLTDDSGTLAGTTSETAADGAATFSALTVTQAGNDHLCACDSADGLSGFASDSFAISPASPSQLAFTTQPAGGTAGTPATVQVTINDRYGNAETGDGSLVSLSLNGGTLGGTTSVAAVNGVATFSALFMTVAGSDYTLSAADTTDKLSSGPSDSFAITPAPASQLVFTTQPVNGVAGQTLTAVQVTIEDPYGNVETADGSSVNLSLGSGTLGGTASVAAVDGVATFGSLSVSAPGNYTLEAADSELPGVQAASFGFTVAGSPAQLAFIQEPAGATAGTTIRPPVIVQVEDQNGYVVTSDASSITLAIGPDSTGSGTLSGTTTVQASGGVATFNNLSVTSAGAYTLTASDSDSSLSAATSTSFTVTPAPAKLAFVRQPASVLAGGTISPVTVDVEDANGNLVSGDDSWVTLALDAGTLNGAVTAQAANGVATFNGLSVPAASAGIHTLTATDGSLASATSADFGVTTAGLDGTWQLAGLLSNGTFITDGQGGVVSGGIKNNDGSALTITGGSYAVNSQGDFTITCEDASGWAYTWAGSVNAAHDAVTVTQTPYATYGNQNLGVLVLNTGSFRDADFTGSWGFEGADGMYGSLTFDGKGDVTGGKWVSQSDGTSGAFLSGSNYSVSADGVVTMTLYTPDKGSATGKDTMIFNGAMNTSQDIVVLNQAVNPSAPKEPTLAVLTKHTGTFALSDLSGTWTIASDGMSGSITFNGAGKLAGSYSNYETEDGTLSGTYKVSATGQVTGTFQASTITGGIAFSGFLDSADDALVVDQLGNAGKPDEYVSVLTNPSATDLADKVAGGTLLSFNPAIPGDKGSVSVAVTNNGQVPAGGTANISLYLCDSAGETTGGTLLGKLTNQKMALGYDQSQTFTFSSVRLPANLTAGTYYLRADVSATLTNPAEGGKSPTSFSAFSVPVQVAWEFGNVGTQKNAVLNLTEADGTVVSFSLSGAGMGDVTVSGSEWDLTVTGTAVKSGVTITTSKPTKSASGLVSLSDITVAGSLGTFSGTGVNLAGPMAVSGNVGTLSLTGGNVLAGASVNAGTIGTLHVGGSFEGTSASGITVNAAAIGSLTVTGGIACTQLLSTGDIGSVSLGSMADSDVFAGVASGVTSLPSAESDFSSEADSIKSFTITGGSTAAESFINSNIAAWTLGAVNLGYPDGSNGGTPFGVACSKYTTLSFRNSSGKLTTWKYPQSGTFAAGDGVVNVI